MRERAVNLVFILLNSWAFQTLFIKIERPKNEAKIQEEEEEDDEGFYEPMDGYPAHLLRTDPICQHLKLCPLHMNFFSQKPFWLDTIGLIPVLGISPTCPNIYKNFSFGGLLYPMNFVSFALLWFSKGHPNPIL